MKKVIDVRDMHTAIHSLYMVTRKPELMLNTFKFLENADGEIQDEIQDHRYG